METSRLKISKIFVVLYSVESVFNVCSSDMVELV